LAVERNRLDADKAALARRTERVEQRETAADARHDGADAIQAVAEGIANGKIDVSPEAEEQPVRLSAKGGLLPRIQKAPKAAVSGGSAPRCGRPALLRVETHLRMGSAFRNGSYNCVSQIAWRRGVSERPSPLAG
ncbi:MAG: hypothetical protein M9936_32755, partial [Caldilinea sp.]|nr:hypothetical protein [Caldilinea sp.]